MSRLIGAVRIGSTSGISFDCRATQARCGSPFVRAPNSQSSKSSHRRWTENRGQDSLTFAKSWVLLGGFAAGAGVAVLTGRAVPAWMGWWALVDAVGFVVARALWLSTFWLLAYLLLWLWIVMVSVLLLVRARPEKRPASSRAVTA